MMGELLAWTADVFVLLGMFLLSRMKMSVGFTCQIIGSGLYLMWGILIAKSYAVIGLNIFLIYFAASGIRAWRAVKNEHY